MEIKAEKIRIKELLCKRGDSILWKEKLTKSRVIALDGKTGKILFDTKRNKQEKVEQFYNGVISSLWADIEIDSCVYGNSAVPVIKCFVTHNSWLDDEEE